MTGKLFFHREKIEPDFLFPQQLIQSSNLTNQTISTLNYTKVMQMYGKHSNYAKYIIAYCYRERLRQRIRNSVQWKPISSPELGCTAVIGVCSRLPEVLAANLRSLNSSYWPALKQVIAVVDGPANALPKGLEKSLQDSFPKLNLKFLHYTAAQVSLTEKLKLPYVYSWLSWCIGISEVKTQKLLIHDYDALILGRTLEDRYKYFQDSDAKVQGISWYKVNGLQVEDQLATTFEAFFDIQWLRSLRPIDLFNKLRIKSNRSIDFDTTLDAQDRFLTVEQRQIMPMNQDELVHPSQMIHQFTMFRKQPNGKLPCYSIPMIPFFAYLSGNKEAVEQATLALRQGDRTNVDILGSNTKINLSLLQIEQVDWALKQMIQALLALGQEPDPRIYYYGEALYKIIGTTDEKIWLGDFTKSQKEWIAQSSIKN